MRLITRTTLRRETPALRATFLSRDARLAADDRRLATYQAQSSAGAPVAAVFSIRPAPDSPEVSRLATDGKLLRAAFSSGRAAARAALGPP